MRCRSTAVFLLGLLCFGGSSYGEIPDLVESEDPTESPLWVSASALFPPGKTPRLELFPEDAARRLEEELSGMEERSKMRTPPRPAFGDNDCASGSIVFGEPREVELLTLERHHAIAWQVYAGTIVDIEHGFLHGYQKAVIELAVEQTLKGENSRTSVFFVFKFGKMETPNGKMCLYSQRHPDEPSVGRRAVFFARKPIPAEGFFLPPTFRDNDVYFERPDGTVSAPGYFGDQTLSMSEFEALLAEIGGAR